MQQEVPVIATNSPISNFQCPGFNALTHNEKLYAYHFARAAWEGIKICYFQKSYEAPGLFYIFYKIFASEQIKAIDDRLRQEGWTEDELNQLYAYLAGFFQNAGNFKSFGDSKFVPEVSKDKFEQFIKSTKAYQNQKGDFDLIWDKVHKYVYDYQAPYGHIDLRTKNGSNSYYSLNAKEDEIKQLDAILLKHNVSELNTRVIVTDKEYQVYVGSANKNESKVLDKCNDKDIVLIFGDMSPFLQSINKHLANAIQYVANDNQKQMIEAYIQHFQTGDVELHKVSQRFWIKDKQPSVETNIGFIESYLDPVKVRAEYEGFVAVVNKEESKLLNVLVDKAEEVLEYMPWPKEYQIDQYKRPDYTSLEVLAFASSGAPIGINIPNYDDIRQNDGFKNVNLGNTIGKLKKDFIIFLDEEDQELFYQYQSEGLFVVVSLHELIGHGAGKLFSQNKEGNYNFDFGKVTNPFSGEVVNSFYKANEQWHSRFGELSSAFEECKADATAIYLSTFDDVIQLLIPNRSAEERRKIVIAGWLFIVYRSLIGLEHYNVEQQKWGQAHVTARYVILQSLLRHDPTIAKIEITKKDGKDYINFKLNHEKIFTSGKAAIGDLIKHLQVYKSIGAGQEGQAYFSDLAKMNDQFLELRRIVMQHKVPRRIELQPDLVLRDQEVYIKYYEESLRGVVESHINHNQENIEEMKDLFLQIQEKFN